jgi:serine/threonine protein kinase
MKKIGKYQVCGLLGRGGMSSVYKVRMPVTGKIAAVKLLAPHPHLVALLGLEAIRARFMGEAITMARLRHPRIVDIWDLDEHEGRPFFLMEYYCNNLGLIMGEGYRVEDPSRQLSLDKAIHYGRQILEGLARLHQADIIHRDIKPYNVLVTDEDTVKITDFGLSRLRGEAFRGPSNLLVGSPYYAAPEQEKNADQADARADLYALGVILYRMLTGMLPGERPPPPSTLNAILDGDWDTFLARALEPHPAQRFCSAREMLGTLESLNSSWQARKLQVCQQQPVSLPGRAPPPASRRPLRRQSIKVGPRQAQTAFAIDDLGRPRHYPAGDFYHNGDGSVTDRSSGLLWQQAGSDYPLPWKEALDYVHQLNRSGFAGRSQWRLPTVEELLSLVTEVPRAGDVCLEPIFDSTQRWLWSSDRRSFTAAWYVSVDMGFVSWQDFSCYYFVRAVCSTRDPE